MFPSDVAVRIFSYLPIVNVVSFLSSSKLFSLREEDLMLLAYLKRLPRYPNLTLQLLYEYEQYTPKKLLTKAVQVRDKVLTKYLLRYIIDERRSVLKGYIKAGRYKQAFKFAKEAKIHPGKYNYLLYKQFSKVGMIPEKINDMYFIETKKLIKECVKNNSYEWLNMLSDRKGFLTNTLLYCCKYNKIDLLEQLNINIQNVYTACAHRNRAKISRYLAKYDKLEYISYCLIQDAYCGYLLAGNVVEANTIGVTKNTRILALLKCNMIEEALELISDNVKLAYIRLIAKRASYEQISLLLPACKRNVVESFFYYICEYNRFALLELFTEYNIQLNVNKVKTNSSKLLYTLLSFFPLHKDRLLIYACRKCVIQGDLVLLSKIAKKYDVVGIKEELLRLCNIHSRPYVKIYLEKIN